MDILQLRSWIFELYEPLQDERQYIVYDAERGNLLVDIPPFSERALRLVRGAGRAALLVVTNALRATDAHRFRDALGVQVAAHEDDAHAVSGGPDVVLKEDDRLRADARAIRIREASGGATVVLVRKAGGVLICGDLDLGSPAARALTSLEFSAVLSSRRAPIWNAGKDELLQLQHELPKPKKRFGILLGAPWDRAYRGRLQDQMTASSIVPTDETAERQAAMGPRTLVVSRTTPDKQERAPRPVRGRRAPATSRDSVRLEDERR